MLIAETEIMRFLATTTVPLVVQALVDEFHRSGATPKKIILSLGTVMRASVLMRRVIVFVLLVNELAMKTQGAPDVPGDAVVNTS